MNTVLLLVTVLGVLTTQVACKVKGVAPDRASLYDEKKSHFTCLDGSSKIPFDQVNDDYCDCRDGSDEPGTAACINSQFACENLGYVVQYIPSSRVNDGICDCCDGSDEYDGKAQCENTCDELAAKLREEQEKNRKLKEEGFLKRQELIQLGAELKKTIQDKLSELETKKAGLVEDKTKHEANKNELEKVANEAKEKEDKILAELAAEQRKKEMDQAARELFKILDVDKDSFLSADELTVHQELDILFDNDGTFTIQESLQLLDNNHKMDVELFAVSYYEKISPHLSKKQPEAGEQQQTTSEEGSEQHQDHSDQVNDYETGEGGEGEHDHEHTDDQHDHEASTSSPSSSSSGDNSKYQEATQKLIDAADEARRQLQETEQNIRNVDSEISENKKKLEMDLGPNGEFASMIDHCFELEDREYVYKLCPFEKTVQKSKSSHVETSIGHWKGWNEDGGNKYASMKFENGLACWNGPQRSTKVVLTCGLENKLTSVSEPNRCEYEMKFETPALCESHVDQQNHSHAHEDL